MRVEKVYFGSVAMYRAKCPDCGDKSLIVNGKFKCCGKRIDKPDKYTRKRESKASADRRIPAGVRMAVYEEQGGRCIYCREDIEFREMHVDHFIPWCYSGDNHKANLVASCSRCNQVKSSKIFYSIIEARRYILANK